MKNINKAIKLLNEEIYRMSFEDQDQYFSYIQDQAKNKFIELYNSDPKFEFMNKENILIMIRLNLKFRFIPLHLFGINIEL